MWSICGTGWMRFCKGLGGIYSHAYGADCVLGRLRHPPPGLRAPTHEQRLRAARGINMSEVSEGTAAGEMGLFVVSGRLSVHTTGATNAKSKRSDS